MKQSSCDFLFQGKWQSHGGKYQFTGGSGAAHSKFSAESVLPEPFHFASFGYGHSGRVLVTTPFVTFDAVTVSGGIPFVFQLSSAINMSKVVAPGPPLQCCIPGTMNSR